MKHSLFISIVTLLCITLFSCNGKKDDSAKKTPAVAPMKLTNLIVSSQFILEPYTQVFTKSDGDSMYIMTENRATYELNVVTNFDDYVQTDKEEVNPLPDKERGEYAHIAITSDSTIVHQYKSYINDRPLITDLTLPITFVEGSFADYNAGKKCVVKHTKNGVEKLAKEFSWQILLELTPKATVLINNYGFKKITDNGKEADLVQNYILKDAYKITKSELPSPILTFEAGRCAYKNEGRTEYEIDFTGDFIRKEDK